ncbi:MAG: VIT domain-containing protein [Bacteroidota bacterium]
MKTKILLLFFALTYTLTSNAYTTLRVQDPQQTWTNYQGVIDTAIISIKPKGAYFECGLYLTYSARGHVNNYDTFEVQQFFDLPEGSIMHDSWLWVGNQIVQASLIDRIKATLIYEGIVKRRQDPSILYKNSATQYELRIFPMAANQTRKVKITYLVPAKWGNSSVQCPLPMNILKSSAFTPFVQVLSYNDVVWQNPRIDELPNTYFQLTGNPFTTATIVAPLITANNELNYTLSSPMQNGVFAAKYEVSATEGFYQVVVVPSQALSNNVAKKAALLFDYEPTLSNTTPAQVLAKAKQTLYQYFAPTDSFNLIFSQLNIYRASNVWLPCDTATIEHTFNNLVGGNPISYYSNLPSLIANGVDFLKTNGQSGELILFSNSDNQPTPAIANQLITDIQTMMSPYRFPVNIVDYTEKNFTTNLISNTYYAGNEYFYKNLSAMTGGSYERTLLYSSYYYNPSTRPFNEAVTELFESLDGEITNFDAYPLSPNGFCYGKYTTISNGIVPVSKPYIQIGKYSGDAPDQIEITGVFNSMPFSETLNISQAFASDELTEKMWVGNYIQTLEDANPDAQGKGQIVSISVQKRVLSLYTAFLALEPSDTTQICNDCEDETGTATAIDDVVQDSVSLQAMPNPFSSEVQIQVHLTSALKESSLQIYNVMGQLVKILSMDLARGNDFSVTWNGGDEKGETVSAGIYILVLSSPHAKHTLKLIKN